MHDPAVWCPVCETGVAIVSSATSGDPQERLAALLGVVEVQLWSGSETKRMRLACGHGEYRGYRGDLTAWLLMEPQPSPWRWEWWDAPALAQELARATYDQTRPTREPWNAPPLTLTCVCGAPVPCLAVDEDEEDGILEGWKGGCAQCGLILQVPEGGRTTLAYHTERQARYGEAVALWEALRPPSPVPLHVASPIAEREDES